MQFKINENGDLFSLNGKQKTRFLRKGYQYYDIRHKKYSIHRLVAEAFIPNPDNKTQINHIDGNPLNNHVNNLEWSTSSENQFHSRYTLKNNTGFSDTPVLCLETGNKYISTRDAWRDTGISYSHISECANGKRKTAGGFHWRKVVATN